MRITPRRLNSIRRLSAVGLIAAASLVGQTSFGGNSKQVSCTTSILRLAGYYGVGPYAFNWRDPKWARMDMGLLKPLAWRSTVYPDQYPSVMELAGTLQQMGPWNNKAFDVKYELDSTIASVKPGFRSRIQTFITPSGFPLKFQVVFKIGFLESGNFVVGLHGPLHTNHFAEFFASWLESASTENLPSATLVALRDNDRATFYVNFRFQNEMQLRSGLQRFQRKGEKADPVSVQLVHRALTQLQVENPPPLELNATESQLSLAPHLSAFYEKSSLQRSYQEN